MKVLDRDLAVRSDELTRVTLFSDLAGYLTGHLEPLRTRAVYLPNQKALLSRDGGRCPADGARLSFDPLDAETHRCPRCHGAYSGERHHRAWIVRYHIWLSERAIHAGLLASLHEPALADVGVRVLDAYAARYREYPNRDNVLGPTRLFFSTYLESIWLVQVVTAAALQDVTDAPGWSGAREAVRAMVRESAELIASFDEGFSNRQVWHAAALAAAGIWLRDDGLTRVGVDGGSGVLRLADAIDEDGFWHEGENYHLFALKGFLLAAEWMRWGECPDPYRRTRVGRMFAAPLATLLPDLTVPARGDSPFGVSVRQPRFAELWEMARRRAPDRRIDTLLARLYEPGLPDAPDTGLVELAEQEEHRPPGRVARARLGWKSLLWMHPDPPAASPPAGMAAALFPAHGAAVLRPAATSYVRLECGSPRGGHAHPDLLHLSVHWDEIRLADFGTATYVSPSLFWYRSTLAHNAPGLAGVGQRATGGWCEALDARDGWAWCRARAADPFGPGTSAVRTVVAGCGVIVDILDVDASRDVSVDLPLHPLGAFAYPETDALPSFEPRPGAGHETGYDHVVTAGPVRSPNAPFRIGSPERGWDVLLHPRDGEEIYAAVAPGPPGPDLSEGVETPFLVRRASGPGRWVGVYGNHDVFIETVTVEAGRVTVKGEGGQWSIEEDHEGITVSERAGRSVRLAGLTASPPTRSAPPPVPAPATSVPQLARAPTLDGLEDAARFTLGEAHYRRSEEAYGASGEFSAELHVGVYAGAVAFLVDVVKSDVVVRSPDEPDPALDNEPAEIHSDGVQCYVGANGWDGYLVLPDLDSGAVRTRTVAGTGARAHRLTGGSARTPAGYRLLAVCALERPLEVGDRFRFNVVVNEARPGRERRAGQLALTGGGRVYLRGDRESYGSAIVAEVV